MTRNIFEARSIVETGEGKHNGGRIALASINQTP